jgi:hypothetical protein
VCGTKRVLRESDRRTPIDSSEDVRESHPRNRATYCPHDGLQCRHCREPGRRNADDLCSPNRCKAKVQSPNRDASAVAISWQYHRQMVTAMHGNAAEMPHDAPGQVRRQWRGMQAHPSSSNTAMTTGILCSFPMGSPYSTIGKGVVVPASFPPYRKSPHPITPFSNITTDCCMASPPTLPPGHAIDQAGTGHIPSIQRFQRVPLRRANRSQSRPSIADIASPPAFLLKASRYPCLFSRTNHCPRAQKAIRFRILGVLHASKARWTGQRGAQDEGFGWGWRIATGNGACGKSSRLSTRHLPLHGLGGTGERLGRGPASG